jgi:methylthioribose-1-phosphate isomerase
MKRPLAPLPTIRWVGGKIRIIDQRALPRRELLVDVDTTAQLIRAIRGLAVRGAPALGIAGAYGIALAARQAIDSGVDPVGACEKAAARISLSRPTAVNLAWGARRAVGALIDASNAGGSAGRLVRAARSVGDTLLEEDLDASRRMARHGAPLVPRGCPVLTHCNTGGLATGGLGTALAVARAAFEAGRIPEVLVDETRPLLQGGRLTLWELRRCGVPARLLCDGASGWAMQTLGVGCVLVGADRVVANGDTANKVGTLNLAHAARAHGVPFFVVAPRSSFDPRIADGSAIPIEERDGGEVVAASGWRRTDPVAAFNPAFDVTPARLITAWITERGIEKPPFR